MPSTKTQQKRGRSTTRSRGARATRASASRTRSSRPAAQRKSMRGVQPNLEHAEELILQALETELGGVQVYRTAVACALNEELREEWEEYLEQTENHVEVVQTLCQQVGLDVSRETPGRLIVRQLGESFVAAMQKAQASGKPEEAEIVAAECVTLAETKDHQNWTLLSELAEADFEWADAIREAVDEVEDEEDEHLYHTMGWARELWIQGLGLPAALPPPEEEQDAKSMAQAAKAKGQRRRYAKAESR